MPTRLNLGCGAQVVDSWTNVDYSLGARVNTIPLLGFVARKLGFFDIQWDRRILLHNLTRPFPWDANSVDTIYTSHTLEHFDREDGRRFLEQCHRVLKPGGILRVLVPDLAHVVNQYLAGEIASDRFLETLIVHYVPYESWLKTLLAPIVQFPHKCMYDAPTLLRILESIGFEAVERDPYDSAIQDIREIELPGRTVGAVIIECRKRQ